MCLLNCPPHLKNVTTLSCEIQKVIFNIKASRAFTTAIGKFLEHEIGFIFLPETVQHGCYEPSNLFSTCSSGNQEVRHLCTYPFPLSVNS